MNNALDTQAQYIELIEASNAGALDTDEPIILHVDESAEFVNN